VKAFALNIFSALVYDSEESRKKTLMVQFKNQEREIFGRNTINT